VSRRFAEGRRAVPRLLVRALPLLVPFGVVAGVLVWQSLQRQTPTIFSDELEMTQISRGIAEHGRPERRGVAYEFTTLVPWLTAPFWWIGSVATAYDAIKAFQAVVMSAAIFPAYGIARHVVPRPWAIVAATLTVTVPALAYAPTLKEEAFAYTASAVALYLVIRAAASPSAASIGLAVGGTILAAATKTQLVVLFPVLAAGLAVAAWRSEAARRRRRGWSRWEWTAAGLVGAIVAVLAYVVAALGSTEIEVATTDLPGEMWRYGTWAVGGWAIGVGIAPAIALLASLARPRAAFASSGVAAFAAVSAAAIVCVVLYAAVKAATLSTIGFSLIVERNVIFLTPLAMVGLASLLAHRDARWSAIVLATAVCVLLVDRTPVEVRNPYFESHGVAIQAWANTELRWSAEKIRTVRWILAVGAGAVLLAIVLLRRLPRLALPLAATLAAAVAAWGIVGELHADRGERDFTRMFAGGLPDPRTWVDRAAGDGDVTVLGQEMGQLRQDIWLTEFWNRRIRNVWSVDGTAPNPGPTLTPDLAKTDGTLSVNARTPYALVLPGVDLAGDEVATLRDWRLVRLRDGVLRLRSSRTGIGEGAWTGPTAAFNRFEPATVPTIAVLTLSRSAFCADVPLPSEVTVRIGTLAIGSDKQPAIGTVTRTVALRVTPCSTVPVELPAPAGPWRIEIESDTFVPAEIDKSLTDTRPLGVQASLATRPA